MGSETGKGDRTAAAAGQRPAADSQRRPTTSTSSQPQAALPSPSLRLPLESRIALIVVLGGLPGVLVALVWLWTGDHGIEVRWTLTVVVVVSWLAAAAIARERVTRPLQTLSNLLSGLREGDYSVRGAGANDNDALGIAMTEINALGNTLQSQRLGAMEATALLRTVMTEIDSAIFAFDGSGKLRLVNREGERLLGQPLERLLGRDAGALGLEVYLRDDA